MSAALRRAWQTRGPLACALWPLSLVYGLLVRARHVLYARGWLARQHVDAPVVVVGNVVAGGAGKTPVVIALVEHLQRRGLRAGVVSRGWGRTRGGLREVHADSTADVVGDEPLLIARRTGVPVFVGERRAWAARALLQQHPDLDVIVSDDGLQHLALWRDVEIGVFDDRGVGNGWLLPAGPLREPWPRPLDLVLRHDAAPAVSGHTMRRSLAGHALRADGSRIALSALRAQPLLAVAAIARPEQFFEMLRAHGLQPARCLALPDHDALSAASIHVEPGMALLCTEKDAVKLWRHRPDAWAVPLQLHIEASFWTTLDARLPARNPAGTHGVAADAPDPGLSSRHGSETA